MTDIPDLIVTLKEIATSRKVINQARLKATCREAATALEALKHDLGEYMKIANAEANLAEERGAEIERLRDELGDADILTSNMGEENKELKGEIEMTALVKSIKKWEKIVAGRGKDHGVWNCALCQVYYNDGCRGCPVFEKTERTCCENTPYDDWNDHQMGVHCNYNMEVGCEVECDICLKLAIEELKFLESLRGESNDT